MNWLKSISIQLLLFGTPACVFLGLYHLTQEWFETTSLISALVGISGICVLVFAFCVFLVRSQLSEEKEIMKIEDTVFGIVTIRKNSWDAHYQEKKISVLALESREPTELHREYFTEIMEHWEHYYSTIQEELSICIDTLGIDKEQIEIQEIMLHNQDKACTIGFAYSPEEYPWGFSADFDKATLQKIEMNH